MDDTVVATARRDLVLAHRLTAVDGGGIAAPHGDMTGGVFVKERVVEQNPAFRDRRGVRHQCHFAQPRSPIVAANLFLQQGLTGTGQSLDRASTLEFHFDIVDQIALQCQRLAGPNDTVHSGRMRRGENLLGWNVWNAFDAVLRRDRPAQPPVALGQTDDQIGALGPEVQRVEGLPVQPADALCQSRGMVPPPGRRVVARYARHSEYRLRQFFGRLRLGQLGKHSRRPGRSRV